MKLYLGPYRLAWDLQNQYGLRISPSTVRRVKRAIMNERHPPPAAPIWRFYERNHPHSLWHGDFFEKVRLTDEDRTAYQLTLMDDYSRAYVYCDLLREPTMNDTIRAMIAAMRKYQTIPKGIVFDNGSPFKGYLLSAFCSNLGIRLIHSSVRHPQTNGKLERAFRDDRREYYDQFNEWIFDELRQGLPEYVRYRNEVRGHYALEGKPSTTRLQNQNWFALPSVLDSLESYARHPLGSTKVDWNCCIRVLGRNGYIPKLRYGQRVSLTETLDGLEGETEDGRVYLLRNYRKYRRPSWLRDELPFCFNFEEYSEGHCPRIAVA
ncbi:MAG: putative transposase [Acidobacteriota bacterium]|nr:putative transposase [Acidobacteriota bacterium]